MAFSEIARRRLLNQRIVAASNTSAEDVVTTLGAVQAQDFPSALWAVGLRWPGSGLAEVQQAIARREIVRTWPMRGTLHFIPARDARWMLELLTPRIIAGMATRQKQLELDEATFGKARKTFTKLLQGGKQLGREAMIQAVEEPGKATPGQRGYHILCRLAMEGLICFSEHDGKEPRFALLEEWIPAFRSLDRAEALTELAKRYFTGHGPATLKDFIWWSGLKAGEARAGLEGAAPGLVEETFSGTGYWQGASIPAAAAKSLQRVQLLPAFDEYLLGYQDRSAVLSPAHAALVVPGGNGMFLKTIVVDGQTAGTWKQVQKARGISLSLQPFAATKAIPAAALKAELKRYAAFMGAPVALAE